MLDVELTQDEIVESGEKSLLEFVERVSKGNATPEEVAALPDVAKILFANAILLKDHQGK